MATTIPEWVPKFIKQTVAYREKQKVTHERLNELFNLLITQGDWNTETIQTLLDNLEKFDTQYIADLQANENTHQNILATFNQTITTIRNETQASITAMDTQQRLLMANLLAQFQEDLLEVETRVNNTMAQRLAEVQDLVNVVTGQYNTSVARMEELEDTIENLRAYILADNQAIADQVAADRYYIEQALAASGSVVADASAIYEALANKADKNEIPTTLPANGGNADTVNGHTVESDVPPNAKFTDTVYTHPATHPPSIIKQDANNRFMTDAERTKLQGLTNYTHPATHPPSIIAQDANNRFVSDSEKANWNGKANGSHTHPASQVTAGALPVGVLATNFTDYTISRVRNIRFGTTEPTSLANGEIYFMYE